MRRDFRVSAGDKGPARVATMERLDFARAILQDPPAAHGAGAGAIDWEQLEWSAGISSRCERRLRVLADAREIDSHEYELHAWLARVSPDRERCFREPRGEGPETAEMRRRARQCLENIANFREAGSWDPAKHPRLGGPPNAGWFAATGGSLQTSPMQDTPPKPDALVAKGRRGDNQLAQAGSESPGAGGPRGTAGGGSRQAPQPAAGQAADAAAQFQAAMLAFLKALDPHVAQWFERHGKLVRRDTTSWSVMGRWNHDFQIEKSGRRDVYVYYVSDQDTALDVALAIINEFYKPNTNQWQGPAARFPNPFDPKKDAAQQLADWQKKAFKVAAAHAALLSKLYVYGVLSFNAGADVVVNISDALDHGLSLGTVLGATTLLGAIISRGKGGALVLKFGQTEVKIASDVAEVFAKLPKGKQVEIAKQLAGISDKSKAAELLTQLVRQAAGSKAVASMAEFFRTSAFGRALSAAAQKTAKRVQGQTVYRATAKMGSYIRKGDQFYLDAVHHDHLEVFTSDGRFRYVLNLDGTVNQAKTAAAQGRRI